MNIQSPRLIIHDASRKHPMIDITDGAFPSRTPFQELAVMGNVLGWKHDKCHLCESERSWKYLRQWFNLGHPKDITMRSWTLLLYFAAISCSPAVSVYHDYDRQFDLSTYKSYDWKMVGHTESNQNPIYDNELTRKRIKAAVDKELMAKRYQLSSESAELRVHYHIVIEDKSVVIRDPDAHNYSPYWLGSDMNAYQYKEGTLIIDLMDAESNALIWRGWAVAILEEVNPEDTESRLNKTIQRILEGLPASAAR